MLLIFSAIGFSISFGGSYMYIYQPWVRKKRLEEAEKYANILLQNTKKWFPVDIIIKMDLITCIFSFILHIPIYNIIYSDLTYLPL